MIIIGFTGTRKGMSDRQKQEVRKIMMWYKGEGKVEYVVHGGCTGADNEFHEIFEAYVRHVRPGYSSVNPADFSFRGSFPKADIVHPAKPYLVRNKDIVNECDILIACPLDNTPKGGTWSTIKYAKRAGKSVIIVDRNG